jgi:hypothetical protein
MIDYRLFADAIDHYEKLGFQRIEAPWLVTTEISDITKPANASTYIVQKSNESKQKAFVASGEQSFLYLINKGFLPTSGTYQTVTPCLRNDQFDETHTKYFMKLELIKYDTSKALSAIKDAEVQSMVNVALTFFQNYLPKNELRVITTIGHNKDGEYTEYDILYDNVELGSYGYRTCLFCDWVYGTGLAEPRFSRLQTRRK